LVVPRARREKDTVRRARILVVACHLPFPPLSGGRRRELELIRRLATRFDLHLLVVSKTFDEDLANARELERVCSSVEIFEAEPLPPGRGFGAAPLQVLRHRCPELTRRVGSILRSEEVDLVHVEGYYLMQHVPRDVDVPVFLVEQNVEYDLVRQHALADAVDGAWELAVAMRAEHDAWRRATMLGVLTREDGDILRAALHGEDVRLVPDGADHVPLRASRLDSRRRGSAPRIAFVGNFGYAPNVDAATHLCAEILPRVAARVPDVRLWLVGNQPTPAVRALAGQSVRVTGRVSDVVPYIDAADVMVCPLRIGGGIKVKSIEALRRGKAIVSSSIGAQGLSPQARRAIATADEPEPFADAVVGLLSDPERRRRAERRAAAAGASLPTWDAASEAVARAYRDLLRVPALVPAAGRR